MSRSLRRFASSLHEVHRGGGTYLRGPAYQTFDRLRSREMTKTRRKIDAALKAKIALEALRQQAAVTHLVQRHQVRFPDGMADA